MAKRFVDTDRWKHPSFRPLPFKTKLIHSYLCDNCDHAGVWMEDYELASFQLGTQFSREDIERDLSSRVVRISENRLFLPDFVKFQYGKLNPENRAHRSVLRILEEYGINPDNMPLASPFLAPSEDHRSPYEGCKDKDKDTDKERGGVGEKIKIDLESVYAKYPRKMGKSAGLKKLAKEIKTQEDFDSILSAVEAFRAHHDRLRTDALYLPYFSTWASSWRDWLDPSTGSAQTTGSIPTKLLTLEEIQ